jgi:hypothetical protein
MGWAPSFDFRHLLTCAALYAMPTWTTSVQHGSLTNQALGFRLSRVSQHIISFEARISLHDFSSSLQSTSALVQYRDLSRKDLG